jgi:signal transduction histidine kinase/ligand-binding sensor domain-containing protein/DNA-binding response OmpR family regulator
MKKLVLHIIFISTFACLAQNEDSLFKFKHLGTSDGLSQSSVIAMEQDNLGRMWLGTRDGLNLYDGSGFRIFRNIPADSSSISNSDILSIKEDSEGFIWIGTYNGLNKYDPRNDSFQRFYHYNNKNSLSDNSIWTIEEASDGTIWIGTSNGLSSYNKKENRFTNFFENATGTLDGLPSNYVLSILQANNGTLWLGTSKGFCKVTNKGDNNYDFEVFPSPFEQSKPFVQTLALCDENTICVGTKNMGILKFDLISERFLSTKILNQNEDVRAITSDDNGQIWSGTSNGVVVLKENKTPEQLLYDSKEQNGISHNYIKSIFKDVKGSIWIGSYYGGVDIWDDSNNNFINFNESSAKRLLSHKVVSSIVEDGRGHLYFGTEGGGITIYDNEIKTSRFINTLNSNVIESDNIKSLLLDENVLWVGTFNKGIETYNIAKNEFEKGIFPETLNEAFERTGINTMKKGLNNDIWIGTFGKGLWRYNKKDQSYARFINDLKSEKSLTNDRVRSLMVDKGSNIWIGTQSGLNLLPFYDGNYRNKRLKRFFYNNRIGSGEDILTIFQDSKGVIWVGIRGKGLFRFDGNKFQPVTITTTNQITSVYAILEGANNTLWMSCNEGLVRYDVINNSFMTYSKKDGLVGNEFSSGAALKQGASTFFFGGPHGVSSFDAENISRNEYVPQVILTDFKLKNKSVSVRAEDEILAQSMPFTKVIALNHENTNFSISFAIPNYINPNSNQYKYRMLGLEENWTQTNRPNVNYTIQRPGEYVFEVKGANNDGLWNKESASLEINVRPAPWLTIWAKICYFLAILGIAYWLIDSIRSKTKLKHKLQLEHLENERKQEINDAKLKFFTNISHEFRTPLTLITGPLEQLLTDYKGSSVVYKKLLVIESNANRLLQLINRLMDFRKLEHQKYSLEAAEGNIVKFLKEIYLSFSEYAKCNGYDYEFQTNEEKILVYYDRPKLEQVFYNLISNAFKYTPSGGKIIISVQKEINTIVINITDSGPGIPEAYRDKVFDRFFEIPEYQKSADSQGTGTGIGLSIAKSIVELHKGTINIPDHEIQGTTFRVRLKLGNDHITDKEINKDYKFSDDLGLYVEQLETQFEDTFLEPEELLMGKEKDTVLLVEDNVPLRNFIKELLKEKYTVLEAGNGREALLKALKHLPSLVISDVIMPEMVGTELCAKLKANIKTSHIPVILLTSRTALIYKFEGLENGADDYISKPFNIKEFKLRVKNLIDSSKRLQTKFSDQERLAPSEIVTSSMDEKLLKKALTIVEDNISNSNFDIISFCTELGVSRTLLFTKIKAWTNFTPNEFIQEVRMKRAAQLLEQGNLNISEVSYQVGFKNPKYFSKCFQKKYGLGPSAYVQKFSENLFDLN